MASGDGPNAAYVKAMERATALDERRMKQIANQKEAINRLSEKLAQVREYALECSVPTIRRQLLEILDE